MYLHDYKIRSEVVFLCMITLPNGYGLLLNIRYFLGFLLFLKSTFIAKISLWICLILIETKNSHLVYNLNNLWAIHFTNLVVLLLRQIRIQIHKKYGFRIRILNIGQNNYDISIFHFYNHYYLIGQYETYCDKKVTIKH